MLLPKFFSLCGGRKKGHYLSEAPCVKFNRLYIPLIVCLDFTCRKLVSNIDKKYN